MLRTLRIVRWGLWFRLALVVAAPLCLLNMTVAACGDTVIFPLSPFFLRQKLQALGHYAWHRPRCLLFEHPPLDGLIAEAETRHRLPRGLLAAVVQIESSGRVHRISPAGAMGPGQLMPSTARTLGISDPFDSEQNLDGSARYLAAQLTRFHDVRLAVAAYNAGPGSIVHRTVPHNGETEYYVQKVLHVYRTTRRARARA
jgi:soluble lytic murein transglycosylase-like protein